MQIFKIEIMKKTRYSFLGLIIILIAMVGCKEEQYVYEVNDVEVNPNNSEKDKEKTVPQFISILYANIYQKALSPDDLVDISELIASIGDKRIAYETVLAKMITDPDIVIPTNGEMRANIEQFVIDTYKRFYVRFPTEAEKTYLTNYIESNPDVTPVLVYFSFATANEYNYY
jgi:hypothetical protein